MVSKYDVCDNDVDNIIFHIVMSCQNYFQERNSLFEMIINILHIALSVSFRDKSDCEVLTCILSGFTN